jgi:hypothetical protein
MNSWFNTLKILAENKEFVKESAILVNLPANLQHDWDNFMRGKTCPLLDNGDHGVYPWDLSQFLSKFYDQ